MSSLAAIQRRWDRLGARLIAVWAGLAFGVGFLAIAIVFKVRSFKEIIRRGREDREADRKMQAEADTEPEAAPTA